jgi:predicted permease
MSNAVGGMHLQEPSETEQLLLAKDLEKVVEEQVEVELEQKSPCCSCWEKFLQQVRTFFVPPVVAIFLALVLGFYDPVRGLFVPMTFSSTGVATVPVFGWAFEAVKKFGGAAVPMVMIVLGGSLAKLPDRSAIHWPTMIVVMLVRLVFVPCVAFAAAWTVTTGGPFWLSMFGDLLHLRSAAVVIVITSCAPTANNIVVMAELWGGPKTKQSLAAMIFAQYCAASLTLTSWILALMSLFQ